MKSFCSWATTGPSICRSVSRQGRRSFSSLPLAPWLPELGEPPPPIDDDPPE